MAGLEQGEMGREADPARRADPELARDAAGSAPRAAHRAEKLAPGRLSRRAQAAGHLLSPARRDQGNSDAPDRRALLAERDRGVDEDDRRGLCQIVSRTVKERWGERF